MIEIIGWAGSFAVLAAYALLSTGRISGNSPVYHWINIAGAFGMTMNGWAHGAFPSVFNNAIWMGIGLAALVRIGTSRLRTQKRDLQPQERS